MLKHGWLNAGDQFPSERRQMEMFGVGRPAVREAMQRLHNWGLVLITHGQVSQLTTLSPASVLNAVREPLAFVINQSDETRQAARQELLLLSEVIRISPRDRQVNRDAIAFEAKTGCSSVLVPILEILEDILSSD